MLSNDPNKSRQAPKKKKEAQDSPFIEMPTLEKTTSGYTKHGKLTWEPQHKKDPKFRFPPLHHTLVSLIVATGGVIR